MGSHGDNGLAESATRLRPWIASRDAKPSKLRLDVPAIPSNACDVDVQTAAWNDFLIATSHRFGVLGWPVRATVSGFTPRSGEHHKNNRVSATTSTSSVGSLNYQRLSMHRTRTTQERSAQRQDGVRSCEQCDAEVGRETTSNLDWGLEAS